MRLLDDYVSGVLNGAHEGQVFELFSSGYRDYSPIVSPGRRAPRRGWADRSNVFGFVHFLGSPLVDISFSLEDVFDREDGRVAYRIYGAGQVRFAVRSERTLDIAPTALASLGDAISYRSLERADGNPIDVILMQRDAYSSASAPHVRPWPAKQPLEKLLSLPGWRVIQLLGSDRHQEISKENVVVGLDVHSEYHTVGVFEHDAVQFLARWGYQQFLGCWDQVAVK